MQINMIEMAKMDASNASSISAVAKVNNKYENMEEAREVAETFESIFISQMLAPMFETVPDDEMFGGGHAESIYKSMQIEEFGKAMTSSGGIGISESIMAEILKMQEV